MTDSPGTDPTLLPPALADLDAGAICLCLDFDGTLVEIAATPDAVVLPSGLAPTLARLSRVMGERLVIVTGRDVVTLSGFLPEYAGPVIASHGAERRVGGLHLPHPLEGSEAVRHLWREVEGFVAPRAGLLFERKPLGAGLHFRQAPHLEAEALAFARALVDGNAAFEVHPAKMAWELRPRGVGKEIALLDWLARPGVAQATPVYFGDDTTDEGAMALVQARGGVGVKVGEGTSCAMERLPGPSAVLALLERWQHRAGG